MGLGELAGYRWTIQAYYDDLFRRQDPERARRTRQAAQAYLARVLGALQPPARGVHLDLGCGDGLFAHALAHVRPRLDVVGLDASEAAVRLATDTAHAEGLARVRFVVEDAEAPSGGPYDSASALSLFNLLPDKPAALAGWRRVVRPGARLVLTDAFTAPERAGEDAGPMTPDAFQAAAQAAGWRVVGRDDITPLVAALHGQGAWPWPEYVRTGFAYTLVILEAA